MPVVGSFCQRRIRSEPKIVQMCVRADATRCHVNLMSIV